VVVADGYAYATGSYSEGDQRKGILHVIDVADPTRPDRIGSVELPEHSSSNVALAGDHAYVALEDCYYHTCSGTLLVIDVSDPAQPRLVSSLDVPGGASGVTVADDGDRSGRYVYLAAGVAGVWVVNVSDAASPRLAGLANTPGRAQGVAFADDLVYVADGEGGFLVLRVVAVNGSSSFSLGQASVRRPHHQTWRPNHLATQQSSRVLKWPRFPNSPNWSRIGQHHLWFGGREESRRCARC